MRPSRFVSAPAIVIACVPLQEQYRRYRSVVRTWVLLLSLLLASMAFGQITPPKSPASEKAPDSADLTLTPTKIEVQPVAHDEQIRARLQNVLDATGWFDQPKVRVEDGVVFLRGTAPSIELRTWAGDLARNTQDVAAVANRMEVAEAGPWDFSTAVGGLGGIWHDVLRALPMLLFGLFILVLAALAGWGAMVGVRASLRERVRARLLRGLLARGTAVLVFLTGVYIVLRISGLTQLALTVVGGTGLIGLALGIAFREITENYLASIFLSIQKPFETGDLVDITGVVGYVRQLNVRTTVLLTLDGNLAQLPNSVVYRSTIRNYSTTPNRREDFVVGIGYDDAIDHAQEVARAVLANHPAVLQDPEPWVLADGLGAATVNLRVYFWLNGQQHSWLKVRSSVIRLVKRAFQQQGISMPDEAREVVFPQGVPVTMLEQSGKAEHVEGRPAQAAVPARPRRATPGNDEVSTKAEGGLASEAGMLEAQARQSIPLTEGENLLKPSGS